LPAAGDQGRVIFLTDDDTINIDNGSDFVKAVSVATPANGDILYYNGGWQKLEKGDDGDFLTLSSGVPAWVDDPMPSGTIVMWSGTIATIPTGWYLCDGSNGTPNLTNRFIVAADADDGGAAKSTITGSALQSSDTGLIPAHSHFTTKSGDNGNTELTSSNYLSETYSVSSDEAYDLKGNSSTANEGLTSSYGTGTKVISVFYALAFIQKG
jgi:hypothetical protein